MSASKLEKSFRVSPSVWGGAGGEGRWRTARQSDAATGASMRAANIWFQPDSGDPRNSREEIPQASALRIGQDHRLHTRSNISISLRSAPADPLTPR